MRGDQNCKDMLWLFLRAIYRICLVDDTSHTYIIQINICSKKLFKNGDLLMHTMDQAHPLRTFNWHFHQLNIGVKFHNNSPRPHFNLCPILYKQNSQENKSHQRETGMLHQKVLNYHKVYIKIYHFVQFLSESFIDDKPFILLPLVCHSLKS